MAVDLVGTEPAVPGARRLAMPYASLTVVLLVVLWQAAVSLFGVPGYLLPSPYAIGLDITAHWQTLLQNSWITIFEVVAGFLASIAIGVPIAVVVTYSGTLQRAIYPLLVGSQTVPKVALAPLMLAWFGFGVAPKVAIVVLVAFFPIVINSMVGFASVPPQMLYLAQSMGASPVQSFWRFRLPHALPSIFSGIKLAAVLAVVGAVVAEFVGADSGLGYLIMIAGADFKIDQQFSAIIILSALGTLFFWLTGWAERRLLPWHVSSRAGEGR
jgi:NitT/TauT family transport system permease protein